MSNNGNSGGGGGGGGIHRAPSLRQLVWDDRDHWAVVTRLNGSVWPRVLWPFCAVNLANAALVFYLRRYCHVDLTSDSTGHRYLAMVMTFLVVTRVRITYDNYMAQSAAIQECCAATRELVQAACVLTMADATAQQWRHDVAAKTIRLLAATVQVLDFRSHVYADRLTTVPEHLKVSNLCEVNMGSILRLEPEVFDAGISGQTTADDRSRDSVSPMKLLEQACRAPVVLAYQLRRQLLLHRTAPQYPDGGPPGGENGGAAAFLQPGTEELVLLDFVAAYLRAYGVLEKHMTTVGKLRYIRASRDRNTILAFIIRCAHVAFLLFVFSFWTAAAVSAGANDQDVPVRVDLHPPLLHALPQPGDAAADHGARLPHDVRLCRPRIRRHGARRLLRRRPERPRRRGAGGAVQRGLLRGHMQGRRPRLGPALARHH